ncbi:MAG: Crp/Fnr family transcriptional regulator [Bacillota bacterium]|jgi:CRP-like cAMP-binding protein|nr:Crp/Fnr family transcriptional regulator [Bacillota bacterium]
MGRNYVKEISEILEKDPVIYNIMKQCPYEILRNISIREYRAGMFTLNQGEIHNFMYIVLEGELGISVESEHGKKYYLNTYRKGNYIGELEMFGSFPYISSVEARTDIKLFEIVREDFVRWVQMDRNLNNYFIRTLCDSTYKLCSNMGANTLYTLKSRICRFLLDHGDRPAGRISISSETLSEYMAVTQRSVNRILKQLKENDIIEISKSYIVIKDYPRLQEEEKD